MNRSWIRRLSLMGACAAPLVAANFATAQSPAVENSARDNAQQNQTDNARPQNDAQENAADRTRRADNAQDQQDQARDRTHAQAGHAAHHAGGQIDDRTLAALLLIGNQKEVAVSQLAAEKAQSPEVKQFAQEMTQAHTQFIGRLAKLVGAQERSQDGAANPFSPQRDPAGRADNAQNRPATDVAQRTGETEQNQNADREQRRDGNADQQGRHAAWQRYDLGSSPLVSFDRELADQCLQSTEKFLGQQQGAEFDRWFMALQFVEHMGMRDKLLVAQRHSTGELKGLVDQGLQTTDQHIRQIEQVMRQLPQAGNAAQRTSNRPAETSAQ
jgi:predicted outer membrane protein